jgi:GxxExxY protein
MTENELSRIVFERGLTVHRELGPGLLENVYEECLCYELDGQGLFFERQKVLPVVYKNIYIELGYRIDIMVENKLIIEVKSVSALSDLNLAQILTYLKLSDCKLGLLINFNTLLFKDGIKRVINGQL